MVPTNKVPVGKRDDLCLREKVEAIERDECDSIDGRRAAQITLNDMFDLYMAGKLELKQSLRGNYLYMFKKYVPEDIGQKKIVNGGQYFDRVMYYYDVHGGEDNNNYSNSIKQGETVTVDMGYIVIEEELPLIYLNLDCTSGCLEFNQRALEKGYVDIRQ